MVSTRKNYIKYARKDLDQSEFHLILLDWVLDLAIELQLETLLSTNAKVNKESGCDGDFC